MTEEASSLHWAAAWGEDVKQNDLLRVNKLGGPVRVKSHRTWPLPYQPPLPEGVKPPVRYGVILEDPDGNEYHMFLQPEEAVFIAVNIPDNIESLEEGSGSDE